MRIPILAAAAVSILTLSAAQAGPDLASAILACSAQNDEKTQLACYNAIAAQLKAASPTAAPQQTPTSYGTPEDFGKTDIPFARNVPEPLDHITAGVANVSYNYFRQFTVTLDNGQVWRQSKSDGAVARFYTPEKHETVTIHHGFLGSYSLTIDGQDWASYKVQRVK